MKTLYDWLNEQEPRGLGADLDDDGVMCAVANHVVLPAHAYEAMLAHVPAEVRIALGLESA